MKLKTLLFLIVCFMTVCVFSFEGEEKVFKLENGLTVILRETHTVPMVAMQAHVKAGSITEGDRMGTGLSHYFEHMLFKGTKRRGPGEIAQTIHKAGGSDMNAYTSFEKTVYHFSILSEYTDTGLDILSDMLKNSVFDKEEAQKEQKVILKEINMKDDQPDSNLYWTLFENAYSVFPYKYPVIGYEDLFKSLKREDIANYYDIMYSPSNVILTLVGDFDMENMQEKVKSFFGDWKRKPVPPIALPEEPRQITHKFVEKQAKINVARMMMGYHSVSITHPDLFAIDCLSSILGGGQTSRLHKRLVEKEKIAYSVFSSSWTPEYPGIFILKAVFDEENYTKVKFAILDEINRFKYEKVSKDKLEEIKNLVIAYTLYSKESITSQASSLSDSYVNTGTLKWDNEYLEGIKKVTPDDIMRVARKYLNYNNSTIIKMIPEKSKTVVKTITDKKIKSDDIKKITLENGITLLLKKDNKLPIISVNTGFMGGLLAENKKNTGISNLLTKVFMTGTKKYSKQDIAEITRKTGSSISSTSGNNSIFVSMKTLTKNFDQIWDIYKDIILNTVVDKKEFLKEKEKILAQIKQNDEDINHKSSILYRSLIFKDHPYEMDKTGYKNTIESIDVKEMKRFMSQVIVPSNTTISIVGDIDINKIQEKVKNTFKTFEGKDFKVDLETTPENIEKSIFKVENMPGKKQSIVRLVFRGVDIKHEDKYSFSVMSNILSGLGSRLFENLRSKHSLAYTVFAGPFNGLNTGAFSFYIATTPEKRDFAIDMLKKEINKLKESYVSDEELLRAKNKIAGAFSASKQSTIEVAEDITLNEMYGLGYNYSSEYLEKIKKVTKDDIMRSAKKYFDLNRCITVIVEP